MFVAIIDRGIQRWISAMRRNSMKADQETVAPDASETDLIESDSLIEEISIDGMCGVY